MPNLQSSPSIAFEPKNCGPWWPVEEFTAKAVKQEYNMASGGSELDLRKVANLIAVAEGGSFTIAASKLRIAQSALSRQISTLENELGIRILERTGRGVVLTEIGERFVERGRKLLKDADVLLSDIRSQAGTVRGTVTLGVTASVSHILLASLLTAVTKEHPSIQLRVVEAFSRQLQEWVVSGRIDIALLFNSGISATLNSDLVLTEDMFLIAPPGDKITASGTIPFRKLAGPPLAVPSRPHGIRLLLDGAAEKAGLPLNIQVEVEGLWIVKALVSSSNSYGVLSFAAVASEVAVGSLSAARIIAPALSRKLLLAHSTHCKAPDATRKVSEMLRMLVRGLIKSHQWPTQKDAPGT